MALILILHVLVIGIILNRLPFRFWTVIGSLAYFAAFYGLMGHYLAAHPSLITPPQTLEDDYYRNPRVKKKSPFDPPPGDVGPKGDEGNSLNDRDKTEEDQKLEDERIMRLKKQQIQTDSQPSTNP